MRVNILQNFKKDLSQALEDFEAESGENRIDARKFPAP